MAIKCNNCGAPIPAPPADARFAACAYCGTAVALPARRQTAHHAASPTGSLPASAPATTSGGGTSFWKLLTVLGVVAGGGLLVALTVKNLSNDTPGAAASTAPAEAEPNAAPAVPAAGEDAPSAAAPTQPEDTTRPAVRRDPRGGSANPKPGATTVPKPTAPTAPTAPAPSPTPTPAPTPTQDPPAPPKVAKASIGNITVSGARPLSEVQSKVSALRGPIRDCYQKHLAERPTEAGTLDMRFSIDSQGRVAGAGARNPMFTSNLVPCVNRTFYTMSFPPSDAGVVEVKLVVTLTSSP